MSVLHNLQKQFIQGGHVVELTLVGVLVLLLNSVWVAPNTAECVAGHWLTSGVVLMLFMGTMVTDGVLMLNTWTVCL